VSSENNSKPSSPDREVKYDLTTVRSVRGLEARTIAKWEKDGWEFVSQEVGKIQTQITFRRPKAPVPWRTLAIIGGVLGVCAVVIVIGVSVSGGGSKEPETSTLSSSAPVEEAPASNPPVEATEPVEPSTEETLVAEKNADLAALLSGPSDWPSVEQFADTYAGRLIEFDGSIGALARHGDYNTRYDVLIAFGDHSETQSFGGPNFQFRDVNTTSDLHYEGANTPDTIGAGQITRVVARVARYEPDSMLFLLEAVSTQFR